MNLLSLSILYFAFGTSFIALLVYLQRQDEVGRKWFLFGITASVWAFFYGFWTSALYPPHLTLMWIRMCHAGAVFIPATWLDFIFTFLGIKNEKRKLLFCVYAASFLLAPLTPNPYFISGLRPFKYFGSYYTDTGPLYHFFPILFFTSVTYGFVKIIQAYRLSSGMKRDQIKYLIWGTGIGFVGGSLTFLPVYGIDFPQYNLLIMPAYPLIIAYALTKHRLFHLEQFVEAVSRDRLAALGLLSASINHEIRSPLFVIQGHAEHLLKIIKNENYRNLNESEREERIEDVLKTTIEQTSRVVEITKRLTDFSKPAANIAAGETVNFNEVIDHVLSFVGYGLKLDNITVETAINSDIQIQGNQKEMEQILLNLIINASQAMEKQSGKIKIEAYQRNEKIETRISDTGPGIAADKLQSIFEPFFTTKESGTGLGLYITKQLVERNKGKISVESKMGRGTTFILEFKRMES